MSELSLLDDGTALSLHRGSMRLMRYVYHPDEWYIAKNAMNMVRDLDPLPHFYLYPSLLILLVTAIAIGQ